MVRTRKKISFHGRTGMSDSIVPLWQSRHLMEYLKLFLIESRLCGYLCLASGAVLELSWLLNNCEHPPFACRVVMSQNESPIVIHVMS